MATVTQIKQALNKEQKLKTVDIKGKDYVPVNERLKYFRQNHPLYTIETDIISLENGIVTIKAVIKDETGRVIATGHAQEKETSSFINKTSYVENCETSAIGRALAVFGIGLDTSVASAEEMQTAILNQNEILQGVNSCNSIKELEKYYKTNAPTVEDLTAFNVAVNRRKKALSK